MKDELLNQLIRVTFLNQATYSKAKFDNAHDTNEILVAADESMKLFDTAVKSRLIPYVEELMTRRIEEAFVDTDSLVVNIQINGKMYRVELKEKTS